MSRRVQGSGSFFVADRKLGPGLMFSTFLAANIGGGFGHRSIGPGVS
jgi:hypothetical protein